nr:glycosyltransferase family 4 protein [Candidatus Freyarchaeota archaeon]
MIKNVLMVGHYVEPPWCDGVVNTIRYWSEGLAKSGLDVTVLSTASNPTRKSLALNGVQYRYFLGSRKRFHYPPLSYIARFRRNSANYLKTHDTDICHLHELISVPAAFRFKSSSRTKFVLSFHNVSQGLITHSVVRRLIERTFDFITVPDDRGRSSLAASGVSEHKIAIIPPAIDMDSFRPKNRNMCRSVLGIPEENFIIMYAGHFRCVRGLEELLYTFRRLKNSKITKESLSLVLAWTGFVEKGYYEKLRREIKNESNIMIVGPQEDLSLLYNAADVVVSPILRDEAVIPIPLNVIEAMACGKIVVSTDVGAVGDFLIDGYNGFVIKPRSKKVMFKKISTVLQDSFDRWKMEKLARETVFKNFSQAVVARKLIDLYESKGRS